MFMLSRYGCSGGLSANKLCYCFVVLGLCLGIAFLLTLSLPAIAADEEEETNDAYIGADIAFVSLDVQGATYNPVTARFRMGIDLWADVRPRISVESQFGFNITDDTNAIQDGAGTIDATLTLNYYLGLYARASLDLSSIITLYGLAGFTSAQISGDTNLLRKGDTESSLSLGIGGVVQLPFGFDGFVEVTQLVSDDNFDALAVGFGIMHKL